MDNEISLGEMAELFVENEKLLCEFYTLCIDVFPAYKESWTVLRKNEQEHADIFEGIKKAIEEMPSHWTKGKLFPQAVKISIENLKKNIQDLRAGKANKRYILNFLMDCEQSLIESELDKSFQTDNKEFLVKLERVQAETIGHRNLLKSIISKEK